MNLQKLPTIEELDNVIPKVQSASAPVICEVLKNLQQPFLPKLSLAPMLDREYCLAAARGPAAVAAARRAARGEDRRHARKVGWLG